MGGLIQTMEFFKIIKASQQVANNSEIDPASMIDTSDDDESTSSPMIEKRRKYLKGKSSQDKEASKIDKGQKRTSDHFSKNSTSSLNRPKRKVPKFDDDKNSRELKSFVNSSSKLTQPTTSNAASTSVQQPKSASNKCKFCDRLFCSKSAKNFHMKACRNNPDRVTFPCPKCDVILSYKQELNRHLSRFHR